MTRLTDEQLQAIQRGCDGVTPGPWFQTSSPWFNTGDGVLAGSPDPHIGYVIADLDDGFNPRDEYSGPFTLGNPEADAAHIARLDPDTIRSIVTELLAHRDVVQKAAALVEALERCGFPVSEVALGDLVYPEDRRVHIAAVDLKSALSTQENING